VTGKERKPIEGKSKEQNGNEGKQLLKHFFTILSRILHFIFFPLFSGIFQRTILENSLKLLLKYSWNTKTTKNFQFNRHHPWLSNNS